MDRGEAEDWIHVWVAAFVLDFGDQHPARYPGVPAGGFDGPRSVGSMDARVALDGPGGALLEDDGAVAPDGADQSLTLEQ